MEDGATFRVLSRSGQVIRVKVNGRLVPGLHDPGGKEAREDLIRDLVLSQHLRAKPLRDSPFAIETPQERTILADVFADGVRI